MKKTVNRLWQSCVALALITVFDNTLQRRLVVLKKKRRIFMTMNSILGIKSIFSDQMETQIILVLSEETGCEVM